MNTPNNINFREFGWILPGLFWSTLMFIMINFEYPLIEGETVSWAMISSAIPIWLLVGFIFGYLFKLIQR